jgi:hypothetical protein
VQPEATEFLLLTNKVPRHRAAATFGLRTTSPQEPPPKLVYRFEKLWIEIL